MNAMTTSHGDLTAAEREALTAEMTKLGWTDFEDAGTSPGFVQAHQGPGDFRDIAFCIDIADADPVAAGDGMAWLTSSYVYPIGSAVVFAPVERLVRRAELTGLLPEFLPAVAAAHRSPRAA